MLFVVISTRFLHCRQSSFCLWWVPFTVHWTELHVAAQWMDCAWYAIINHCSLLLLSSLFFIIIVSLAFVILASICVHVACAGVSMQQENDKNRLLPSSIFNSISLSVRQLKSSRFIVSIHLHNYTYTRTHLDSYICRFRWQNHSPWLLSNNLSLDGR